jgi:hypothetical protein
VYTPRQIFLGTFLCGPLAGLWFIKCNYEALGKPELAKKAIHWGSAASALILTLMPVLPVNFPAIVLPLAYALVARQVAESTQVPTSAFAGSGQYEAHSNWSVARHGAIAFTVLLAIAFVFILTLSSLGLIALA